MTTEVDVNYDIRTREDVTRILGEDADDVIRAQVTDADCVNVARWAIDDFRATCAQRVIEVQRVCHAHGLRPDRAAVSVACRKMAAMALVNIACRSGGGQMSQVAPEAIRVLLDEALVTTHAEIQHHCATVAMTLTMVDGVSDELASEVGRLARCLALVSTHPGGRDQIRSLMKGPIGRRIGDLGRTIA